MRVLKHCVECNTEIDVDKYLYRTLCWKCGIKKIVKIFENYITDYRAKICENPNCGKIIEHGQFGGGKYCDQFCMREGRGLKMSGHNMQKNFYEYRRNRNRKKNKRV